jgi:hypothetical protein
LSTPGPTSSMVPHASDPQILPSKWSKFLLRLNKALSN